MFITHLPNNATFSHKQPHLSDNVVIRATTSHSYFYPEHQTPYLLAANFLNRGTYLLNKKHIETGDRWFYFLNANDNLEICFSSLPLQTLFVLFTNEFIQDCWGYAHTPPASLVNNPDTTFSQPVILPPVPLELEPVIKQKLLQLQQGSWCKEDMNALLFELLMALQPLAGRTQQRLAHLTAVKKSTREELYRRLFMAREMMHDGVYKNHPIDDIARQVCLNKYHFLASFKELYKTTPHQYYRELKLQRAYQLLQTNHYSVTTVCYQLGFESIGSFSNLFKRRFGVAPSIVNRQS